VLRFEESRSVITVQREFDARFKKDAPHKNVFFNQPSPAMTSSWILVPRPRSKHEAVAHKKLGQFPLLTCMLWPCRMRNKCFNNFRSRTILLCMPCAY
jgi:hypothetical protein